MFTSSPIDIVDLFRGMLWSMSPPKKLGRDDQA